MRISVVASTTSRLSIEAVEIGDEAGWLSIYACILESVPSNSVTVVLFFFNHWFYTVQKVDKCCTGEYYIFFWLCF